MSKPDQRLAVTPAEGKGFGYLQFLPDRYVNYFLPRRFFSRASSLTTAGA